MSNKDKQNWQVLLSTLLPGGSLPGPYLVVLVARPLQELLRKDWTAALLRNRRLVGVAVAIAVAIRATAWQQSRRRGS